ncbi:DUF3006 domain-containing protein [Solibacillus sp. FSL H8-0538]|uniref:DUF3006 domain-containing protein n=1 Tax=Solibacillus sp. FSL H8-0538 TaxID=2921400 RepID=UPI0030F57257
MNSSKYTLDRFEGDYAIFLKRPEEQEPLLILRTAIQVPVKQGDIVHIQDDGKSYTIEVLQDETASQQERIQKLMQQLRNGK